VLPFVDMSQTKDQEYFSDGISEEVLNLLTKIPQLQVTARTSSFSFKGKEVAIPEIARTARRQRTRRLGAQVRQLGADHGAVDQGRHRHARMVADHDRKLDDIFAIRTRSPRM
jgi:TolB-like protein